MTIAALTWPEAFVYVALIATVALVLAVLIWSMFSTGQTAIGSDSRHREPRRKVDGDTATSR